MKHILVPIGSSPNAKNTLQYAIDFASEVGAKVFVFRAYNYQTKAGTIININDIIQRETNLYLRTIVASVDTKNIELKLIAAKGNVLDSIQAIDDDLGIDLIIMGSKSNSIKEEVYVGNTSGRIIKKTKIPSLIIPVNYQYRSINTVLTAFKSGIIKHTSSLKPLQVLAEKFNPTINLLLVKTPKHSQEDLTIHPSLDSLKSSLKITENATTYQGVLEHFQSNNPDLLCVFKQKRGFFKKLWEKNIILKEEFYCPIPLLVIQGSTS